MSDKKKYEVISKNVFNDGENHETGAIIELTDERAKEIETSVKLVDGEVATETAETPAEDSEATPDETPANEGTTPSQDGEDTPEA